YLLCLTYSIPHLYLSLSFSGLSCIPQQHYMSQVIFFACAHLGIRDVRFCIECCENVQCAFGDFVAGIPGRWSMPVGLLVGGVWRTNNVPN
ncbi:hypothetical protein EDC04DRAFT_2709189, partial [Pisolithus marmoratus]